MDKPLYLQRQKNRKAKKVKEDITMTDKILREDIYDLLKESCDNGKGRKEAIAELRSFFSDVETVKYKGNKEDGIERIVSDIDSYNIKWMK